MNKWLAFEFRIADFIFSPIKGYQVNEYIVIKYKLQHGEIISEIPYYVSNGKTNELRANMLFPFMNFNEREKNDPSCPSSFYHLLSNDGLFHLWTFKTPIFIVI